VAHPLPCSFQPSQLSLHERLVLLAREIVDEAFRRRDLADRDYVYLWADGVHFTIRLEEERLCTLVVIGVRPDGTKEVVALEDGYRESAESWRTLLRDLKRRGLRAPVLAIGDGALGFWAAVRDVWPETAEQRCWVHRIVNVLDKLPRSLQPRAKQALHEIMYAETRAAAYLMAKGYRILAKRFRTPYGEIDLVARKRNLLVFVEVKARGSLDEAAYAVTPRQQQRIINAAQAWLMAHPEHAEFDMRFDAMLIAPRRLPRHLLAAFDAST